MMESRNRRAPQLPQELRKTCDHCRKRKIKCSNENPCARCQKFGLSCRYSPTRPTGRPSKRQATPPSNLSSSSCPQTSDSSRRTELIQVEGLDAHENLDNVMTLDTLGAPMTFPTPPDELAWLDWSALDNIINGSQPLDVPCQTRLLRTHGEPHTIDRANEVDGGSQARQTSSSNAQCQCGELVREHMNNKKTDISDLSEFIIAQRKSEDLAQQVLSCTGCGSLDSPPSQLAGNVLLFGAVMLDAVSSYQTFTRDQKQVASTSLDEGCSTQMYLVPNDPIRQHLEFRVERQHAWPLAKVLLRVEIDRLSRIRVEFVSRQWRAHERGHETCLSGGPCHKLESTKSSSPADFCPRSIEPTEFFNCFRTAKHLQTLIESVQKDLES